MKVINMCDITYELKEHEVRISESSGLVKYFCYRVQVSRVYEGS